MGRLSEVNDFGLVTPLMVAAQRGYGTVVKELLKNGADPTRDEPSGLSALDRARQAGHEVIVDLLEAYKN